MLAPDALDISEPAFSVGVDNAEEVSFNATNQITFSTSGDVAWDKLITSGAVADARILITSDGGSGVVIDIDVTASGAVRTIHDIDDVIYADASGNYTYEAHGMKFELTADDFTKLDTAGNSGVTVNLTGSGVGTSGAGLDVTAGVDTASDYSQTLDGSGTTFGDFTSDIAFDVSDTEWNPNISRIEISGTDLGTSGTITVTIYSGAGVISSDVYELTSGAEWSGTTFSYDNHGVTFTYDVNNTDAFNYSGDITQIPKSIEATNSGAFEFTISDDNGATVSVSVTLTSGETYSLSGVVNAINAAASGTAGTFGSDVAVISGDAIKLVSQSLGADSNITITDAGALSDVFTAADDDDGSDSSVDLTLNDASGNAIDTATIAPSATTVAFEDSDGNDITFELEGYATLSGVDVSEAFGASSMERAQTGLDISDQASASSAITTLNDAINTVSDERAKLGAVQNRLEHTIKNLDTSAENLQASESRIRDVDMAKEMMEFTKNNILQQAAQSMLAQANQAPQGVLQLLR